MRKKIYTEPLLPTLANGGEHKIQYKDMLILELHSYTRNQPWNPVCDIPMLSITFQWIYDEDKVSAEGDEYICEDGDVYREFQIEVNTVENSLYSQILTSTFYGNDMPSSDFSSEELKNKLVRLAIVNNCFLIEVRPIRDLMKLTEGQRKYLEIRRINSN